MIKILAVFLPEFLVEHEVNINKLIIDILFFMSLSTGLIAYEIDPNAIVVVEVKGKNDFCSGALVSKNNVLTARHCVEDLTHNKVFDSSSVRVGYGENRFSNEFKWLLVKNIDVYNNIPIDSAEQLLGKDLAMLTLENTVPFTPLEISQNSLEKNENTRLKIWGFGEDYLGYIGYRKLKTISYLKDQGNLILFNGGACRGDSGGPILNDKNQIVGIVSIGTTHHCVRSALRYGQRINN